MSGPDAEQDDARMRALGHRLLEGVDLATVKAIDGDTAERLAEIAWDDPSSLTPQELHALALWAAKGGMLRN